MPFINVKYSGDITPDQEENIKAGLGLSIKSIGKTEDWLMVGFEPNSTIYFKGEKPNKAAYVEVSMFSLSPLKSSAYDEMTANISLILAETLEINPDKIYVKYSLTEHWGWNGGNL